MSSIFGYFTSKKTISSKENEKNSLLLWNRAYGRNAEDTLTTDNCFIGCCFEHFSDNVPERNKILHNNHKYAAIDALIYNRPELLETGNYRKNLSDEELLFEHIIKFGFDALKDINGDFAGAVYDETDNSITLFRDHMGIRPLFYYYKEKSFYFSTDIRGLFSIEGIDTSLSNAWIYKTLSGYPALTDTIHTEYEHIFCIEPASYSKFLLRNDNLQSIKTSYWKLGSKKIRLSSDKAYQTRLRDLISDSVKRRLDAVSGLVGAELSGGLDSGVIDILINRFKRDCVFSSWSYSPKVLELAENDERLIINDICKQEGITCNYKYTDFSDDSNIARSMRAAGLSCPSENSPELRYILPSYTNTLSISNAAQFIQRNGAKVVFTGHGGDEGVSHRCNPYEMFHNHEYLKYLRYIYSTTEGEKHRLYKTFCRTKDNLTKNRKSIKEPFKEAPIDETTFLNDVFRNSIKNIELPIQKFAYDPIAYINNGGSRNRLDNVALYGAYNQVRYLVPYLDYRVIDFAVSIPRYQFIRKNQKRYVFREAFKDIIPESLYRLTIKENYSRNNIKQDENWYVTLAKNKKYIIDHLDRNYWSSYIDFDKIDTWAQKGKPSDEELAEEKAMMYALSTCISAERVVKLSKEAVKNG